MSSDLDQPPRSIRPQPYIAPDQVDTGIGVIALATGITGLILSFIPFIGLLSWVLCPAAIITGIKSFRHPAAKGLGIAGLVMGVLGLIVCILWLVVTVIVVYAAKDWKDF